MRLSTKGRYGLRAMVDLAVNSSGDRVSLASIAERQDISENYLEQVFSSLRKAGLVQSVKGAQGGYLLTRSPAEITAGDVLKALEGSLSITDEAEGHSLDFTNVEHFLKLRVWDRINECIDSVVEAVTLEDLAEEYRKKNSGSVQMYYI